MASGSRFKRCSKLSERMPPEQMAERLTEYFDAMTTTIFARRGMVNDFIGDAILAVFGAPLDDPDHARHAIESALEMLTGEKARLPCPARSLP